MRIPTKQDSLERFKKMGLPMETVLDVGVLNASPDLMKAYPDKLHLLFEPIIEWNEQIILNYREMGIEYEIINIAVSDRNGMATLELSTVYPGQPVTHARIVDQPRPGLEKRDVPTATLDMLLQHRNISPYLLKIDVDGAELAIIAGAKKTLESCSIVIIEAHVDNFLLRSHAIEERGFSLFDIVDFCYYDDRLAQFDLIFINTQMIDDRKLGIYQDGFNIEKWVNYRPYIQR